MVFLIQFALVAYLLNFLWESWHAYYLYTGYHGKSFKDFAVPRYLRLISYVSLVDAAILTAVLFGGYYLWGEWSWLLVGGEPARIIYYLATTIGIAIWIEIKGVFIYKEWAYLPAMPTIFGIGISPLTQLAVTGFFAFLIV